MNPSAFQNYSANSHPFGIFVAHLQSQSNVGIWLEGLKNRHGINVNLLLFILWAATMQRGRLGKKEITTLSSAISHWHQRIYLPLVRLKDQLNGSSSMNSAEAIRTLVKSEVLAADQIEQQLLVEALISTKAGVRSLQQQLTDACHNLAIYCKSMQIQLDVDNQEEIVNLLKSIFPAHSTAAIVKACENILQTLMNSVSGYAQLSMNEL